jgi:acetolactate synthase-1/2/3 large subunit
MIGYNHHNFANKAYKIIVDIDHRELAKPTIIPDMPVHADAKDFIQALLMQDYEPSQEHKPWVAWCKALLMRYPTASNEYHKYDLSPINPYVFIDNLFSNLSKSDKIICGNGSACVVTFQACKIKQGQRLFTNSGCAAMGYGLPAHLA